MISLPTALSGQIGSPAFKVILGVLALALAAAGGAWLAVQVKDGEIATLQADQDKAEAAALRRSITRLQAAKARGDALEQRLAKAEEIRKQQAQEAQREIKRLTRGVPCLNAGTVRLLNGAPGIQLGGLSNTAGRAAATDAGAASDTDVAGWIDHAIRQYETCRDRLQTLIDWHKEPASE